MRGNNLSDTSLRTMKNNPNCPQNSTDISHYGNELMESVNPNTFNNLGLPRGCVLCTLQSLETKDQRVRCYYIRTLYKTIAIRAAFCYLCLTSSCSGNTLTDNQTSVWSHWAYCWFSWQLLTVFPETGFFFSP